MAWFLYDLQSKFNNLTIHSINTQVLSINRDPKQFPLWINQNNLREFGNTTESKLNEVIAGVLKETKPGTLNILVTDGIYSISGSNADVSTSLMVTSQFTKGIFLNKIRSEDVGIAIIKAKSMFDGYYYDLNNKPTHIKQKRPFYYLAMGHRELLRKYIHESLDTRSSLGIVNWTLLERLDLQNKFFTVVNHNIKGKFRFSGASRTTLTNAEKSQRPPSVGIFGFAIGVNMNGTYEDPEYFLDSGNYLINNDSYRITEIVSFENWKDKSKYKGDEISHIISIQSDGNYLGPVEVSLIKKLPGWINETHVENDKAINGDEDHTFGFKYLIEGITAAYIEASETPYYLTCTIKVTN
jgi:hypothetical protein